MFDIFVVVTDLPLFFLPGRSSSLVLASALPPIPGKVVEKILKGQFIDFKELLMDNVALMTQLQELGAGAASIPV